MLTVTGRGGGPSIHQTDPAQEVPSIAASMYLLISENFSSNFLVLKV